MMFAKFSGLSGEKIFRSRQEVSNDGLLARFGFDTAENEPFKVTGEFPIACDLN